MIFDWNFKAGLAVGLEHQDILGYDEASGDAYEAYSWVLHLGPLELRLIFGCDAPETKKSTTKPKP